MKKLLLGLLIVGSFSAFASADDNRKTCYAFLEHDTRVVGMMGFKLFVEKPDGSTMQIQTPGNSGSTPSGRGSLERMIPGLERQLRSDYSCDHLVYEGVRQGSRSNNSNSNNQNNSSYSSSLAVANDNRKACYAFLQHDPYVVGMTGFKLFVEKPDGSTMQIQTPGNSGSTPSGRDSLERMIPGLERQLRSDYTCDHLIYEGVRQGRRGNNRNSNSQNNSSYSSSTSASVSNVNDIDLSLFSLNAEEERMVNELFITRTAPRIAGKFFGDEQGYEINGVMLIVSKPSDLFHVAIEIDGKRVRKLNALSSETLEQVKIIKEFMKLVAR